VNFQPTTYSERTGLHYGSGIEGCTGEGAELQTGAIIATDGNGDVAQLHQTSNATYGGTLSTAGGLVFSSTVDGDFFAMDDETLEVLWQANLGAPIEAPPITFAVNGTQYVAVPAATSLITTALSNYVGRGSDPNASSLANLQSTWTLWFFALDQ